MGKQNNKSLNGKININKKCKFLDENYKRPSLRDKKNYQYIKNKIKEQSKKLGTKYFYTISQIENTTEYDWADICFLSKKYNNIFYNVTIYTSLSLIDEDLFFDKDIINKNYNSSTISKIKESINNYSIGYIKKDFDYLYGVGLDICISNKECFDDNDIYKIIEFFWENEEKDIIDEKILGNINNIDMSKINFSYYEYEKNDDEYKIINDIIYIPKEENINNIFDFLVYRYEIINEVYNNNNNNNNK